MALDARKLLAENPVKTRDDVALFLKTLLDPLQKYTSPGGALIRVGATGAHFDERAAQIEGFARPLWGLASLLAGGLAYDGADRWTKGFATGPDPSSPEFWGYMKDRDQRMVECSPIGFAISMAPQLFWDPLTLEQKRNLESWLAVMNEKEMPNTNWLWFRVFANLGLSRVNSPLASKARMEADLKHLDTFVIPDSNGWSRDGPPGILQLDYYSSSFAIQFSQLVYAKLAAATDPERSKLYKDRAKAFSLEFILYFDPEGRAIPFGRSNTYRFAQSSFWGALAFSLDPDEDELPSGLTWGIIKGLQLRNLRYWAHQTDAYTSDGIVTIGYCYPNGNMTDNYNSPGSPYWCCKSFISLALPATHPFWTAEEVELPLTKDVLSTPLPTPMHIATSTSGLHTYILSSGQQCSYLLRHSAAKYGKFAYSSHFGFSFPTGTGTLEELGGDSALAVANTEDLGHADGEFWRTRRVVEDARIEHSQSESSNTPDHWLRSIWRPYKDVTIETFLIPPRSTSPYYHTRVHRISFAPGTKRNLTFAEGGWATYGQGRDGRAIGYSEYWSSGGGEFQPDVPEGVLERDHSSAQPQPQADPPSILCATETGVVGIIDLTLPTTTDQRRKTKAVKIDPNSNLIFSRAICPTLMDTINGPLLEEEQKIDGGGCEKWVATAVFGLPYPQARTNGINWKDEWEKRPSIPQDILKLIQKQ